MKGKEIIEILEKKYPKDNAEPWDNVGVLVGDPSIDVKKVMLTLDVTENVVNEAIKNKIDMIISHHPMIFDAIKTINIDDSIGRKIIKLIKNNMLLYAMHTNLDASKDGLNDYILKLLGIKKSEILDENKDRKDVGIGRYYELESPMSIGDYTKIIKKKLKIENVRVITEDITKKIQKIAIVNGAGMSYWKMAYDKGIDLFVTGDVRHHDGLDALELGLNIIDVTHYDGEKMFSEILIKILKRYEIDVTVYSGRNIFMNY